MDVIELLKDYVAVNEGKMSQLFFCKKHNVAYRDFTKVAYLLGANTEAEKERLKEALYRECPDKYPDNCEICKGANLGVRGNENIVDKELLLGYDVFICDSSLLTPLETEQKPKIVIMCPGEKAFRDIEILLKALSALAEKPVRKHSPEFLEMLEELREELKKDEQPVCETCKDGKGKGWFTCPVCHEPTSACQPPPESEKKPTIEEIEKLIGTPGELELMPDGSTRPKYSPPPEGIDGDYNKLRALSNAEIAAKMRDEHFNLSDANSWIICELCSRLDAQRKKIEELGKIIAQQNEDITALQEELTKNG